jgi:hypothetical protein
MEQGQKGAGLIFLPGVRLSFSAAVQGNRPGNQTGPLSSFKETAPEIKPDPFPQQSFPQFGKYVALHSAGPAAMLNENSER